MLGTYIILDMQQLAAGAGRIGCAWYVWYGAWSEKKGQVERNWWSEEEDEFQSFTVAIVNHLSMKSKEGAERSRIRSQAALIDRIFTEQLFAFFLHLVKKRYGDKALQCFGCLVPIVYLVSCYIYNKLLPSMRGSTKSRSLKVKEDMWSIWDHWSCSSCLADSAGVAVRSWAFR